VALRDGVDETLVGVVVVVAVGVGGVEEEEAAVVADEGVEERKNEWATAGSMKKSGCGGRRAESSVPG